MRVRNKAVLSIRDAITSNGQDTTKKLLAADLLDARAMIREMLNGFTQISAIGNDRNIFDSKARQNTKYIADTMLEKSKEYAE